MSRRPRLDGPGALHHVYARGFERGALFADDRDRRRFVRILHVVLASTGLRCLAWALMENHYHLLVRTGPVPLARCLLRINTRYAQFYNRRRDRVGYVFQGRFGSARIDSDTYQYRCLAYVHLNPVEVGVVRSLDELETYPWTGHAAICGNVRAPFQDVAGVMSWFSDDLATARAQLRGLLEESVKNHDSIHPRSWRSAMRVPERVEVDERTPGLRAVSGGDEFLKRVTSDWTSRAGRRVALIGRGWTIDELIRRASTLVGADVTRVRHGARTRRESVARAIVASVACDHVGEALTVVARATGVRPSAIAAARRRGQDLLAARGVEPGQLVN